MAACMTSPPSHTHQDLHKPNSPCDSATHQLACRTATSEVHTVPAYRRDAKVCRGHGNPETHPDTTAALSVSLATPTNVPGGAADHSALAQPRHLNSIPWDTSGRSDDDSATSAEVRPDGHAAAPGTCKCMDHVDRAAHPQACMRVAARAVPAGPGGGQAATRGRTG